MTQYTAITIGPIVDTLCMVDKPAALWASSYLFSFLSRCLCEEIVKLDISAEHIVTPYFPQKGATDRAGSLTEGDYYRKFLERTDGIGLFHDHIIVRDEKKLVIRNMEKIRNSVLDTLSRTFAIGRYQLDEMLMIRACSFPAEEKKNVLLTCAKMLDCLELPGKFCRQEAVNPVLTGFTNENVRTVIRKNLGIDEQAWQLVMKNPEKKDRYKVRDLPDLAASAMADGFKKNEYYCMLRSDGDNMSEILAGLADEAECRDFSRICLEYCAEAAEAVGRYGGLTIYSGGDDLFAIVPCEGNVSGTDQNGYPTEERGTVLSLVEDIRGLFDRYFKVYIDKITKANNTLPADKQKKVPSLSFGVLICHKKYPLYEAVGRSWDLLSTAKQMPDPVNAGETRKNAVAVQLLKHSGQSEEILIAGEAMHAADGMLSNIVRARQEAPADPAEPDADAQKPETEPPEPVLLSAAQKILIFRELFDKAQPPYVKNLFVNTFDDTAHQTDVEGFLHETLPDFYAEWCLTKKILLCENHRAADSPAKTLGQLLRMMKFFVETGTETTKMTEGEAEE